jgi:hypothetical protein
VPGTYVLNAAFVYGADAGGYTGTLEQKTLVLGLSSYSYAEAVGTAPPDFGVDGSVRAMLPPAALSGGTTSVVGGTTVDLTELCPSATTRTFPFTSQSGQLTLFTGAHLEIFQMMP